MPESATLEIRIEERGGAAVVRLRGELDLASAGRLEDDLRRIEVDEPRLIAIDLSALDFMDSSGLRVLIAADRRAREAGRRLAIGQGNALIRRVLTVTRLDEQLHIVEDLDALG